MRQREQETAKALKTLQAQKAKWSSFGQTCSLPEQQISQKADQSKDLLATPESPGVMSSPMSSSSTHTLHPLLKIQRKYGNWSVQRAVDLMKKEDGKDAVSPEVEAAINKKCGGGQVLENNVRTHMETSFGTDFRGVRVHTNSEADKLNRAVSARAFTTGQDVFFRQGEYNPDTSSGRELLAHELTHVVQQSRAQMQTKLLVSRPNDALEQEADKIANEITALPTNKEIKYLQSLPHLNFGRVRLHANKKANESAQLIDALAYTVASNIVLGSGQYRPDTDDGRRLLAHELVHVIQQEGMPGPMLQTKRRTGRRSTGGRGLGRRWRSRAAFRAGMGRVRNKMEENAARWIRRQEENQQREIEEQILGLVSGINGYIAAYEGVSGISGTIGPAKNLGQAIGGFPGMFAKEQQRPTTKQIFEELAGKQLGHIRLLDFGVAFINPSKDNIAEPFATAVPFLVIEQRWDYYLQEGTPLYSAWDFGEEFPIIAMAVHDKELLRPLVEEYEKEGITLKITKKLIGMQPRQSSSESPTQPTIKQG